MKKIAKISLVAAIAVAGFNTANAQPLEEAIKNVDVTGSVVYRYNNYSNDTKAGTLFDSKNNDISKKSSNTNEYKAALGLASKVNDDVKFNSRFVIGKPSVVAGAAGTQDNGFATLDSSDKADQNVDVSLSQAYFGYTGVKNTTVNVGKQGLTTPWTVAVDSDDNEQTGTGILALSTVGPVTLAGAYFNQTNLSTSSDATLSGYDFNSAGNATNATKLTAAGIIDGSEDIMTVGAIATLAPVTADAWYLTMTDRFDTYTIGAKATTKLANIDLSADARFVSLTLDKKIDSETPKNTLAKLVVSGDAGLVDAKLAYAKTGKEGGLTALDNDASTTLLGWSLNANGKTDADYIQAVLGFDILSNLNLSANYGNLQYITEEDSTEDIEEEEVYAQLTYKMSKNLTTYVRYGTYDKEVSDVGFSEKLNDDTRGRLQVEYTF